MDDLGESRRSWSEAGCSLCLQPSQSSGSLGGGVHVTAEVCAFVWPCGRLPAGNLFLLLIPALKWLQACTMPDHAGLQTFSVTTAAIIAQQSAQAECMPGLNQPSACSATVNQWIHTHPVRGAAWLTSSLRQQTRPHILRKQEDKNNEESELVEAAAPP
ncbi:hypothetical protein D5F01_LYC09907 [Larimichthys crocea]|uniref:Uncharacterized protein n=1 Tax=Larimichthys crocea TaxID=215358 RepID=A0A6G0IMH4_LARCR|nr:hypothetical protein D5F01_LYC09907 [Larimichthys crocea]